MPPAGPRMGVLTTPVAAPTPLGTITVVGEVERPAVLTTRQPHPRLDAILHHAGGLTSGASGSLTIFRSGQPRIQLTLRDALQSELQHGDVIVVSPAWVPPSPERPAQPRLVTLVCHNLGETPRLLRVPVGEASILAITYRLGQVADAVPPAGVVLPAAQLWLSDIMQLPTGTMLYFDPRVLNRATLHAMLAVRDPFDPVVDFDALQANGISAAGTGGLTPVGPIHPSVLLTPPSGPPRTTAYVEAAAPLGEPAAAFQDFSLPDAGLTPPSIGQELALLNASPAASEPPRSLVPVGMSAPPAASPARTASAAPVPKPASKPVAVSPKKIEPASSASSWAGMAGLGWGVGLGILITGALGLTLWIRRQLPKRPAPTPLEMPVRQQPAAASSTRLHGAVVGDRNLRVDPPHEALAGPHFGRIPTAAAVSAAAASRTSAMQVAATSVDRPLGPAGAGGAGKPKRAPMAPASANGEGSGLLDRVLRAMQRERDT